jgi:catechol-2,3-dioxygenase
MAISNGSQKVISPVKLAHVVLRTSPEKFQEMVSFYKTFLGAHAALENEMLSFQTYDDEHHRVAIVALPGLKPKDSTTSGLEHISFAFDNINDLLGAYTQRKELGIKPTWSVNHGPTLSIYYRDPDGNNLETQIDSFDTPEEATAAMLTEDFKVNPFGVDFDPEDYIEKLKQGVPVKQLLERPVIGPRGIETIPIV